jgi:hypothetical protein
MKEGSLDTPTRHAIAWEDPDFADRAKTEAEMQRVFDVCHTCRRCFNLCDAFPRLFDLIDNSATGEVDGVAQTDYRKVADACTLCDMCFMTKCPYVPPHEFNVDFPHLMLRYRAVELKEGQVSRQHRELVETDRNGRLAGAVAPLANWASQRNNRLTRPAMEKTLGIDRRAVLPKYHRRTFVMRAKHSASDINRAAPAAGRKAVLYATCFVNYNNLGIGEATRAVLARNRVDRDRDRLSTLLRHAATRAGQSRRGGGVGGNGFGRPRAVGRQGLQHHRVGPVLRADAQIRVAADPAPRSSGQKARRRELRDQRIYCRHRPQGGACPRSEPACRRRHNPASALTQSEDSH